jgi:hypothetical protein
LAITIIGDRNWNDRKEPLTVRRDGLGWRLEKAGSNYSPTFDEAID